ncbi:MAG: efflux RND transporter periplasmic adaptor subunit [SAR324 cluster bacterium]|nr:efflux RND transporter periplasmic adaptor subunit [SAR324 cluster bacterium]
MRRAVVFSSLIALVLLLAWQIYQRVDEQAGKPSRGKRGDAPVAVEIAHVEKQIIQDIGEFTGTLFPNSRFIVAPKISGKLKKLLVNIGDHVENGQLVAVLEDEEYVQQLRQTEAALEVAKANLEAIQKGLQLAKREMERAELLSKRQVYSEQQRDTARARYNDQEAKYKVAQANLIEKQAALQTTRIRISYTQIRAVWEDKGPPRIVGERFVDAGTLLNVNTPIASILDISNLTAVIHVTGKDYFKIQPGQQVSLSTAATSTQKYQGKVLRIAPLIQETSREARVEIEVPNPDETLKPGMFIRASIQFDEHKNATVVPSNAIATYQNQTGVFLADLEKKQAQFIKVETGITQNRIVEILQPELSGNVITLGQHLLRNGSSIIVPALQPASSPKKNKGDKAQKARSSKQS